MWLRITHLGEGVGAAIPWIPQDKDNANGKMIGFSR